MVNDGRCYGQSDLPCRTDGHGRLPRLGGAPAPGAVWVVSNLMRTHQTAAAIVCCRAARPRSDSRPRRAGRTRPGRAAFRRVAGQTYAALAERQAEEYHRFWFAPARERAPGGESFRRSDRTGRAGDRSAEIASMPDAILSPLPMAARFGLRSAMRSVFRPKTSLCFTIDNISLTRLDHFDDPTSRHGHSWRVAGLNQPAA
ncbi:MAG: histidine phosphatase family protein [Aliidongia sp.]